MILLKYHNTIIYGAKSLKMFGLNIWNQLPGDIKSETSYTNLRSILKLGWDLNVEEMCALIFQPLSV